MSDPRIIVKANGHTYLNTTAAVLLRLYANMPGRKIRANDLPAAEAPLTLEVQWREPIGYGRFTQEWPTSSLDGREHE